MAELKLTKTELRIQQLKLAQLQKYLPTLQLKKALLQIEVYEANEEIQKKEKDLAFVREKVERYAALFSDQAAYELFAAVSIQSVQKSYENIAGVEIPIFEKVVFAPMAYGLFDTPVWLDSAVAGVKELIVVREQLILCREKKTALEKELREVSIRVNLFEKILIPRAQSNIRKIRIFLGDQQLAAVAQAKVAKRKILERKRGASMIIDVKKYLFIGVKEDLEHFFVRAQQHGFIEFISAKGKRSLQPTPAIEHLMAAIKILRKQPVCKMDEKRKSRDEVLKIAEEVIALKANAETIAEHIRITQAEIVRVAPLGDFLIDDFEYIEKKGHRKIKFYCMKSSKRDQMKDFEDLIYLGTEYDLDYYMSISKMPIYPHFMMEMKVELPVSVLREKLDILQIDLRKTESRLKELAKEIDIFNEILVDELNLHHLNEAKNEASYPIEESSLFVVEAWVPENKVHSLFAMLQGMAIHAEQIVIEEKDRIPTYMENKGVGKVGEDLVHIYDTPAAKDKDPSRWVLWSFCLFFAMIIADAGYGLIFLAITIFITLKKPHLKGTGKRFIKLMGLLACSCIVWGVLTTSYFGLSILPQNPLSRFSLIGYLAKKKADYHLSHQDKGYQDLIRDYPALKTAKTGEEILNTPVPTEKKAISYPVLSDYKSSILLELALLTGVIHISFSFIRYLGRSWAGCGWLIFMVGGYLYFPSVVQATSLLNFMDWISTGFATLIGLQMIYIGIVLAILLALIQKRLGGLTEIMNVVTVFADILSYLRLYALSLAATIMADTFNEIGAEVGLALGFLIILVGHCVNIVLGIQGGVIHGLRLNFIEWYHYSFIGGGRLLAPLHKLRSK